MHDAAIQYLLSLFDGYVIIFILISISYSKDTSESFWMHELKRAAKR